MDESREPIRRKSDLKTRIPWPIKFAAKLAFGIAGVDYRWLKRAGLVEHGRMDHADFAAEIFDYHVASPARDLGFASSGTLLEVGPGDSVATGVLGMAAGFTRVALLDAGCFADLRPEAIERLFLALGARPLGAAEGDDRSRVLLRLHERGVDYLRDGIASMRTLPDASISYSFSNTVLQHVFRDEVPLLIEQLGRVHRAGSYSSHSVNFTDHFSGGFLNRRFPDWFMESALVKRANLYTNRVPPARYLELFEAVGLLAVRVSVDFFDSQSPRYYEYATAREFLRMLADGRPILRTKYLVQKR